MRTNVQWVVVTVLLLGGFVLMQPTAARAFFPFGGLVTAFFPPLLGPCGLASIEVGPPAGGTFVLPAGTLFPFFNFTPGHFVLGTASGPVCGAIFIMGTSP